MNGELGQIPSTALSSIRLLAPASESIAELILQISKGKCFTEPFAEGRLAAIERLSDAIRTDSTLRKDAAAVALAFWLRRANVAKMRAEAVRGDNPDVVRVPAGTVFHIAPANVDTMFVYSWAMSFLMGNANLVRLSTKPSAIVSNLLRVLNSQILAYPQVWTGNVFLTYEHDDEVTRFLSEICDHRVIWGGDETVARIRAVRLNPHASERAFASKLSAMVLSTTAIAKLEESDLKALSERIAADIEPFNQMGCSSPHVCYWVGGSLDQVELTARRLDGHLASRLGRQTGNPDAGAAVKRTHAVFRLAADGLISSGQIYPGFCRVVPKPETSAHRLCIGGGIISHRPIVSVEDVAVDSGMQTLTYAGFSDTEVRRLAVLCGRRGLDRIVPVGSALAFSPVWDGHLLWNDFARFVSVQKQI